MTCGLISNTDSAKTTIKLLYSYGGKIIPRRTDGKLRYVGGHTRVLSIDRSISFAELMVKLVELCGSSISLKCKLPNEDLDTLVFITNDDDLKNLIDEYNRFSKDTKITAVLFPIKSLKKITPVSSAEDLCSAVFRANSLRVTGSHKEPCSATYHHRFGTRMVYRHQYNACGRGAEPGYPFFVPTSNYRR